MDFLPTALIAFAQYRQFILYRLQPANRPNKLDKIPVHSNTLSPVNAHDPENQLSFAEAMIAVRQAGEGYGIGFVFTDNDPFFFLDIDNCIDEETGQWNELAHQLLSAFAGAAVEVSISGKGLHIFGTGSVPQHSSRNNTHALEFYTSKRFVALTGTHAGGDAGADHTAALAWLVQTYFCDTTRVLTPQVPHETIQDDQELVRMALSSKQSASATFGKTATFKDLWEANEVALGKAFPDPHRAYDASAADMSLAWHLAFWTGKDEERMERLMRMSGLYRDKWDVQRNSVGYLALTLKEANARQNSTFKLKTTNTETKQSQSQQNDTNAIRISATEYPDLKDCVKPLNTIGNLEYLLKRYGIIVRYNEMSRVREVNIQGIDFYIDDKDNAAVDHITNLASLNGLPITRVDEHLRYISYQNRFHPIVECLKNNLWDGTPRLDGFIGTLKTADDLLSHRLVKKWMLAAIVAVFSEEGFVSPGVLVLQGKQRIGKTHWIKSLDPIDCDAVREGAIFDAASKDSILTMASYWIVELGELDATFKKSDIAKLKAHITNAVDVIRRPYAKGDSRLRRRTIYAASVNEANFLVDVTGNRRWWTIEVESISREKFDMVQVWAEAYSLVKNGACMQLSEAEHNCLNDSNVKFEQIDPFLEITENYFDWSSPVRESKFTATDVLRMVGYDKPSKSDCTRMGYVLQKLTGKKPNERIHRLPPKIVR